MTQKYLLALGGNLPVREGSPVCTLAAAIRHLAGAGCQIIAISRFFETPCFPAGAGPDYVNAAITVKSDLDPTAMLDMLHQIEARFGRERTQRWGMRTLDIDLIAAGDAILPDAATHDLWRSLPAADQAQKTPGRLILPHPRLQDRAFVLVPLNDIAPHWRHPVLGLTIAEMLEKLDESDLNAVVPL